MSRFVREPFGVTAAVGVAISAVVVPASVGVHHVTYRLQLADPSTEPLVALTWFDVDVRGAVSAPARGPGREHLEQGRGHLP